MLLRLNLSTVPSRPMHKHQDPERTRVWKRASRFQIKLFELLRRCAELAELVNGRACERESERFKRLGEQLVKVGPGCEARGDMRTEMLAATFWNKRRNVLDQL